MSLTSFQKSLFNRIRNGESMFSPEGEGMSDEQFQAVAQSLIDLEAKGYIAMSEPHKESMSGHRYIDRIWNCRIAD